MTTVGFTALVGRLQCEARAELAPFVVVFGNALSIRMGTRA
jgi:hypothetical protein